MFGAILAILYLNINSKKAERSEETNEIANLNKRSQEISRILEETESLINLTPMRLLVINEAYMNRRRQEILRIWYPLSE